MRHPLLIVLLTSACTSDKGDTGSSADAEAGLAQANVYRALLGLSDFSLDSTLNDAAQAHADYMSTNNTITHQESSSDDGYTGEWAWDRAEAAGYDWPAGTAISEVVSSGYSPAGAVDGWMNSVYHRIPFTTPGVPATGFGQAGTYSSMTLVLSVPDVENVAVLYPADGQTDVPASFNSDEEFPDPAPGTNRVGPPISVTVGDTSIGRDAANPYSLSLESASLSGPDGDVELLTADPDSDDQLFNTVMVLPTEPLKAGAVYGVAVTVSWSGGDQTLSGTFTTAD